MSTSNYEMFKSEAKALGYLSIESMPEEYFHKLNQDLGKDWWRKPRAEQSVQIFLMEKFSQLENRVKELESFLNI